MLSLGLMLLILVTFVMAIYYASVPKAKQSATDDLIALYGAPILCIGYVFFGVCDLFGLI